MTPMMLGRSVVYTDGRTELAALVVRVHEDGITLDLAVATPPLSRKGAGVSASWGSHPLVAWVYVTDVPASNRNPDDDRDLEYLQPHTWRSA